jgi:hypothetical protein
MSIKYTKEIEADVYRDDYDPEKGFHKVLFKGRSALQARELNQLQTIIQTEIERFGRNIFKEGASLQSPGISINKKNRFIKLNTDPNDGGVALPADSNILLNRLFKGQQSGVIVKVVDVVPADGADPATVYAQYTNTLNGTTGTTSVTVDPGEELLEVDGSNVLMVQTLDTVGNPATGYGTSITVGGAEFFAVGHFVVAPVQTIILSKYTNTASATVGFRVDQEIVTVNDDETLYDNQGNLPNYTAPGADRYRINLVLTTEVQVPSDASFIYLARVENGSITESVTGYDQYNKINDYLAVRTKEESGDYAIKPFYISFTEGSSDTTTLQARLSSGTAYVNGYRIVKNSAEFVDVPKALDQRTIVNEAISGDYGNYVILTSLRGIPNINNFSTLIIKDEADFEAITAETVGTAKVRAIEKKSNNEYKLYIFDISMNLGKYFQADTKSIGANGSNYGVVKLENNVAKIYEANNNDVFFPFPNDRPVSVSDVSLTRSAKFSGTISGTGSVTITAASGEVFSDNNEWIVAPAGTIINDMSTLSFLGIGTNTITINGLNNYSDLEVEILAFTFKGQAAVATKTLSLKSQSYTFDPTVGHINLFYPDIVSLDEVRLGNANGEIITGLFSLDGGQRDGHYEQGRVLVKPDQQISPEGTPVTLFIKFTYFVHGSGDFFAPSSYINIDYANIPSYTTKNGTSIDLRQVLDFRSTRGDTGSFATADSQIFRLPKDASTISADVTYYLPRYDKLVLDETGDFRYVTGRSDFNPKFPATPSKCMELYRIRMGAGTVSDKDIITKMVENKRYTMRDIGKIEKRIDRLEEQTALSLLELDTVNTAVLDADGNNRTKSGILADNFSNQFFSDTSHSEYRAANDPLKRRMRAQGISNNIGLYLDEEASTGVVLKGDNVYLSYTEALWLNQSQVTGTVNCQPYINMFFRGTVTLSPASDDWKETEYLANNVVDGGTILNTDLAVQWDEHTWNWGGTDINDLEVGAQQSISNVVGSSTGSSVTSSGRTTTTTNFIDVTTETVVNRVVASETIREVIGDRIVDVSLIPFMRSKLVYFKAEGLQPNTQVFPYFDGLDVSAYCKMEPFVNINVNKQTEVGNLYRYVYQHPIGGGPTKLFTNGRGSVEGSFFIPGHIPGNARHRFRTGEAIFTLLDISAEPVSGSIDFMPDPEDAGCIAEAIFSSTGVLFKRQLDVLSTRVLTIAGTSTIDTERTNTSVTSVTRRRRRREPNPDPVAQSFFVPEDTGMFVTKVGVFFAAKDQGAEGQDPLPVQIQIRQMINGIPSREFAVPGSIVTIPASNVVISSDASAETIAVFDEPVYLSPFGEYCIVVFALNDQYEIFVSEMGNFVLGTTTKKVNTQPYLGSFFKSQNNKTWTPDQYTDMKLKIYRAEFNTAGGSAILKNAAPPRKILQENPINFFYDSDHTLVKIEQRGTGLDVGDAVLISDATGTLGTALNNTTFTVQNVDPSGFTINVPSLAAPTPYARIKTGGESVTVNQSYRYEILWPSIEDLHPINTSIVYSARTTSGRSYAGIETPNVLETSYNDITIKQNNYYPSTRLLTYSDKRQDSLIVKAAMTTESPYVSPVIDLQRASATLIGNLIDNPSTVATTTTNKPAIFTPETSEGSAAAKHITKPVTLANSAVGLKILLGANRPSASNIRMFYKVSNESPYSEALKRTVDFNEIPWVEIEPDRPVPSDENPEVFREYAYTVGDEYGLEEAFTQFQIKIVMTSSNNAKVPVLGDLRVIALGD